MRFSSCGFSTTYSVNFIGLQTFLCKLESKEKSEYFRQPYFIYLPPFESKAFPFETSLGTIQVDLLYLGYKGLLKLPILQQSKHYCVTLVLGCRSSFYSFKKLFTK